jgi:ABC-type multidrug transport system fused ATPase/permease subunit
VLSDPAHVLTPEIAFVSLTLFNQLRTPMSTVAELISQTVQVFISNKRLKEFLVTDELEDYVTQPTGPPSTSYGYSEDVIDVQDASFAWESKEAAPSLSNINLSVSRGQLIAVIGKVGSGKSSLLNSLLGEMERIKGHIGMRGTVAYVPQQPWIQNETVRNNIVFGRHFDEYFYNRVLDACALFPDLSILSNGDMTGKPNLNH